MSSPRTQTIRVDIFKVQLAGRVLVLSDGAAMVRFVPKRPSHCYKSAVYVHSALHRTDS
jgi:hypothetical protein